MNGPSVEDASNSIGGGWRGRLAWAFYDWANSPFTTLIITFVFPAYFAQGIVGDEVRGQTLWGYTIAASGLIIALLSPLLGAVADAGGRQKPYMFIFTMLCIVGAALLWFAEPQSGCAVWAMVWVALANIGFEFGVVFNNAMLPDITSDERLGRWSGWAWGLGYAGGLLALLVALVGFVQPEAPLLGLPGNRAENIRIVGPLTALWFAVFAWPVFVFTPDRPATGLGLVASTQQGLTALRSTLSDLAGYRSIGRFLLAHMIYADGLSTVFAFGGIYAAGTFHMSLSEVITFGIVLNVAAGAGAFGFAWIDDWIGSRRTVLLALIGLLCTSLTAVMAETPFWFWVSGSALGLFVGPAQAASRSLMARLTPLSRRSEFFGLFALSGKATAFLGPTIVSIVTDIYASQRMGLSAVILFFIVGFLLLLTVREPSHPTTSPRRD
jgi:UMF1 family MFS transporter